MMLNADQRDGVGLLVAPHLMLVSEALFSIPRAVDVRPCLRSASKDSCSRLRYTVACSIQQQYAKRLFADQNTHKYWSCSTRS